MITAMIRSRAHQVLQFRQELIVVLMKAAPPHGSALRERRCCCNSNKLRTRGRLPLKYIYNNPCYKSVSTPYCSGARSKVSVYRRRMLYHIGSYTQEEEVSYIMKDISTGQTLNATTCSANNYEFIFRI